jgi:disulfide bond formation protein DsbB
MAFFWQLIYHDLPCPLCLLQRVGFVLVGIGLLMNVRFGPSALHYGVIVLSAIGGAFAAGRQVLLHIPPGDAGYGLPFLGMHFYTWAFVLFVAFIVYAGVMLMLDRRCVDQAHPRPVSSLTYGVMWLFFILVAANLVSTLLECGFGACPDDPTSYLWLS